MRNVSVFELFSGEANKQLGDYKFKLQKAEQDVSTLQANVSHPYLTNLSVDKERGNSY
jgi:hypothetical protein